MRYERGVNRCAELARGHRGEQWRNVAYWCPACKFRHSIRVREDDAPRPSWTFDGNFERPTFTPSVDYSDIRCHHVVTSGMIAFQNDCTHAMKGQTVELPFVDQEGYELDATPSP
ncbi:MAG: DUF6527 family protein [Phycisphaerales bacterium]